MSIAPGNKKVFPSPPPPNSSESRENEIISRTQRQMFGGAAIDNPARTYGGGTRNSIGEMEDYDGKRLQESYRVGLERSANGHDGVADR